MENELLLLAKRQSYNTNHILHLLLSIITVGCWIPIWVLVAISNALERNKIDRKFQ